MLDQETKKILLNYLSYTHAGKTFSRADDLNQLSAHELLKTLCDVSDESLPFFISLIKEADTKGDLFQKLMGDHKEENGFMSEEFFHRYMNLVMQDDTDLSDYNALLHYLPKATFADLAFIQSRHSFFLNQTIDDINEFLLAYFNLEKPFETGEQDRAWEYFWGQVLK